jgi:hypothetical protein
MKKKVREEGLKNSNDKHPTEFVYDGQDSKELLLDQFFW